MLEELDHRPGLDGFLEDLKVEIPNGQAGDDRQGLPIEVKLENRRGPPFFECFLIAGQRLRFQSSINPSFRSGARPTVAERSNSTGAKCAERG
jgi:hypothetical protein